MLTVACVLKSGGIYDATWVARLRDGVARHYAWDHRFVCLSDVEVPCERIPLEHDWPGWWSKIELFKLKGSVLFFDLDSAIVGSLSDLDEGARTVRGICMLQDFYRPAGYGSGVMAWNDIGTREWIYRRFAERPDYWMARHKGGGDQAFLEELEVTPGYGWQQLYPGQIVSYKVHCRNGIPPNARVVCLHGQPKFADMPANDPVRLAWEQAA